MRAVRPPPKRRPGSRRWQRWRGCPVSPGSRPTRNCRCLRCVAPRVGRCSCAGSTPRSNRRSRRSRGPCAKGRSRTCSPGQPGCCSVAVLRLGSASGWAIRSPCWCRGWMRAARPYRGCASSGWRASSRSGTRRPTACSHSGTSRRSSRWPVPSRAPSVSFYATPMRCRRRPAPPPRPQDCQRGSPCAIGRRTTRVSSAPCASRRP